MECRRSSNSNNHTARMEIRSLMVLHLPRLRTNSNNNSSSTFRRRRRHRATATTARPMAAPSRRPMLQEVVPVDTARVTTTALCTRTTQREVRSCLSTPSTHTQAGDFKLSSMISYLLITILTNNMDIYSTQPDGRLKRASQPSLTCASGATRRARARCSASTCWTARAARSEPPSSRTPAISSSLCSRRAR